MEGWRKIMLLMVLTGEETDEPMESRLLLTRDADEEERRKDVRRVEGERRDAMAWKREDCILGGRFFKEEKGGGKGSSRDVDRCFGRSESDE